MEKKSIRTMSKKTIGKVTPIRMHVPIKEKNII